VKTFSTELAAAYASGSTTLCNCLRVLRADGLVCTFTSADVPIVVGGESYESATGLDVSNLVSQSGLAVDNMDLTILPDETNYPQVDILAGRWDFASFWLFECDYTMDLSAGSAIGSGSRNDINLLKRGTTGEADPLRSSLKFEFRGLKQALQQTVGAVTSPTCRYKLGSTSMPDGLCFVDLSGFTNTYGLTAVNSGAPGRIVTASSATEADDYYGEGILAANDGANAGYSRKVKTFASGVFTLALEMPYAFGVGDSVTVIAGCRKRHERSAANPGGASDCADKFDNVVNFGGEPHVPGADAITADPDVT